MVVVVVDAENIQMWMVVAVLDLQMMSMMTMVAGCHYDGGGGGGGGGGGWWLVVVVVVVVVVPGSHNFICPVHGTCHG